MGLVVKRRCLNELPEHREAQSEIMIKTTQGDMIWFQLISERSGQIKVDVQAPAKCVISRGELLELA